MGTGRPQVEITAATLAGGAKNQDRYAYGDGWAFVLDGASSFAKTQPERDGGWYAERLKQALSKGLADRPIRTTREIVEGAIRAVAELHGGDADSCPTSTIALVRWDGETVEVYLLGDSSVVLISSRGEEVISDTRLADVARPTREEYRWRLRAGQGFSEPHRELLQQIQAEQSSARNRPGGYWIAGAEPEAAWQGMSDTRPLATVQTVILATDGAAAGIRYGVFSTWTNLSARGADATLRAVHSAEEADPQARRWPRSKLHDDKTALVINLTTL